MPKKGCWTSKTSSPKNLWACMKLCKVCRKEKLTPVKVRFIEKFKLESWKKTKIYNVLIRNKVHRGIVLFLAENKIDIKSKMDERKRRSISKRSDSDTQTRPIRPIFNENTFNDDWLEKKIDTLIMKRLNAAKQEIQAVESECVKVKNAEKNENNLNNVNMETQLKEVESKNVMREEIERSAKINDFLVRKIGQMREELLNKNKIIADFQNKIDLLPDFQNKVGRIDAATGKIFLGENIHIEENIFVDWVNWAKPSIFVRNITKYIFGEEVLKNSTLSGKFSNRSKKNNDEQPMILDPIKVMVVKAAYLYFLRNKKRFNKTEFEIFYELKQVPKYIGKLIADLKKSIAEKQKNQQTMESEAIAE